MASLFCQKCAGEGTIYTSRYGGNDPDVYPVGKCEACDGSGSQPCERHEWMMTKEGKIFLQSMERT